MAIAALQELCLPKEGQLTKDGGGHTFFWKAIPSTEKWIHSVGCAIKNELVRKIGLLPVGDIECLMTLQLNLCYKRKAILISAYVAYQQDEEVFY